MSSRSLIVVRFIHLLVESSRRPSAWLSLGVRGESCCRAVEREALVCWVVSVSIIMFQGWSLEGVIVFLRGSIISGVSLFLVFRVFFNLGFLAWGSEFIGCAWVMPAVWHGLTPRLPSHYTVPYDQV